MLSGVKIIPRDQIDERRGESSDSAAEGRRRSGHRKEKYSKEKKGSRYESSDDEELQQIKKAPRRKKWYSSEEYSSSRSSGSSDDDSQREERKCYDRKKKNKKKKKIDAKELDGGSKSRKKKSRSGRKTSEDFSSSSSGSEKSDSFEGDARKEKHRKGSKKDGQKKGKGGAEQNTVEGDFDDQKIVRKEMGLEWMLRPEQRTERSPAISVDKEPLDNANEEATKENPRELNPYLKDNGSGYPEEDGLKSGGERRVHSSVIGDGGASWRLKALKRAKEQAARDGRNIEEVVAERWGSLGHLAVSAASHRAAPSRAHLDSIRNRKRGLMEEQQIAGENEEDGNTKKNARNYLKDVSLRNPDMRVPKVDDSLSWRKRRGQNPSSRDADAELISAAMSNLNKFSNDGSFMQAALGQRRNISGDSSSSQPAHGRKVNLLEEDKPHEAITQVNEGLSANQLAAKALQLRMKGKHEEADKLLQEVENLRNKQLTSDSSHKSQNEGGTNRNVLYDVSHQRKKEEDADRHLAKTIMQNRRFSTSGQADDEYDFDGPPRKRTQKKGASNDQKATQSSALAKRILTQQERCFYCFENPKRPRHLVVSIANFTYLMLPMQQPVVPGHCCIVTMQHESSTRTVDDNVWEEIRNFKKCLIMMFAKQEKDLVFLETVMGLARQQRHCLIECLPLPREVAGDAPLYFKKAIDEAEDEWSQHNAKKLIDTSVKGLRASIPKDFPYFHVEFGLNKGFVHVIDDEKDFKSSLGLNVIRGMMRLPEEDMHRRRRSESEDTQRRAAASFMQDWEPFDWTKQLD